MSSSPTARLHGLYNPDTHSELEDLVLQIRYHNLSTVTFLLALPDTCLQVSAHHTRKTFYRLQQCGQNLKRHYGWTLASDHEQVARVENILDSRIGSGKARGEIQGSFMNFGERKIVKETFADFESFAGELEQAYRKFEQDMRRDEDK